MVPPSGVERRDENHQKKMVTLIISFPSSVVPPSRSPLLSSFCLNFYFLNIFFTFCFRFSITFFVQRKYLKFWAWRERELKKGERESVYGGVWERDVGREAFSYIKLHSPSSSSFLLPSRSFKPIFLNYLHFQLYPFLVKRLLT